MDVFQVRKESTAVGTVVSVDGELDLSTAPRLGDILASIPADSDDATVIDLTDCTFIDSSGTRAVSVAAREFNEAGRKLSVVCPPENRRVMFVFELVGLETIVDLRTSLDACAPERT
jgi:anti-sigma B factor antagonist